MHPTRLTQCQNHSETNNIATADKIILALLPIFIRHLLLAVDIIVIVLYIFVSWSILIPVFPLEAFITEIALLHVFNRDSFALRSSRDRFGEVCVSQLHRRV